MQPSAPEEHNILKRNFIIGLVLLFIFLSGLTLLIRGVGRNESSNMVEPTPEDVVYEFIGALKNNDKAAARKYLSPDADRAAFTSTYDEGSSLPSLYNQPFTYMFVSSSLTENDKSYVKVDIYVKGQTLHTTFILAKSAPGGWQITDSETITNPESNVFPTEPIHAVRQRVLITVDGPVELYITSPEGMHAGYDPASKRIVHEIDDTPYENYGSIKQYAIPDFEGTWELKVIGVKSGHYILNSSIINSAKTSTIEGNLSPDEVRTYMLHYPATRDEALEISEVKY